MKKFALIKMNTLKVVEFDSKEELTDAMKVLELKNINCIPLKHNPNLEQWYQLEPWRV